MSGSGEAATVHASAVRFHDKGVLIRGASGSGKSSLVLALLTCDPDRARLVADDRVVLTAKGGQLVASVPDRLAGLLEVRGLGVVRRPFVSPVPIDLVVDLKPLAECPRLPDEEARSALVQGVPVARLFLPTETPYGPDRVAAAIVALSGS